MGDPSWVIVAELGFSPLGITMVKGVAFSTGRAIIYGMIPTTTPSDATALELIRTHNFCTARLVDEFLSMRECHQFISPSLTVDDSIRDVAWDIIRDGVKISLGDAIKVVNHSVALYTSKMEVA